MILSKRAKVVSDKPTYKKKEKSDSGGTIYHYDDKAVSARWKEKIDKMKKLEKDIKKVREKYEKDLSSDDARTRAIAAIVGVIDDTSMRIGNEDSVKESATYGATTLKVEHVTFSNGKARFKFKGKSGVDQDTTVENNKVVKVLKELVKGKKSDDFIFEVDGSKIWDRAVNRYLQPMGISAKDLRGFHANRLMKEMLKKKDFKEALDEVAEIVGHKASTLKNQYLDPELVEKNEKKKEASLGIRDIDIPLSSRALNRADEALVQQMKQKYFGSGLIRVPQPDKGALIGDHRTAPKDNQMGIRSGVKVNDLILAAWQSLKPFLPSSAIMTSGARTPEDQVRIINNYWHKTKLNERYSTTDPFERSKILIQNGWIVGPPSAKGKRDVHLTGRAFDVSGADINDIAEIARKVSRDPNIPVVFSQVLVEDKNNAVHIGIRSAQYDADAVNVALQKMPSISHMASKLAWRVSVDNGKLNIEMSPDAPDFDISGDNMGDLASDKEVAPKGKNKKVIDHKKNPETPPEEGDLEVTENPKQPLTQRDWIENSPLFLKRKENITYNVNKITDNDIKKILKDEPKKFFYLGLHKHKKFKKHIYDALSNIIPKDADFYFKFDYHKDTNRKIKKLTQAAAEYLAQQNPRGFFYYHLHRTYPELGRGAVVQLIDTNPDSFFDLGLNKDYPDYVEQANNARNIKDPNKVELEMPEWLANEPEVPLSMRDKNAGLSKRAEHISPIAPMKLRKVEDPDAMLKDHDDSDIWVQQKIDGFKTQAIKDSKGSVKVYTRRGEDFTSNVDPLIEALENKMDNGDFWLGELAWLKNGKQSISDIQTVVGSNPDKAKEKLKEKGQLVFYVYDLLWSNGKDITKSPYEERYNKLKKKAGEGGVVQLVKNYSWSELEKAVADALKVGGEGAVLKPKKSVYKYGPKGSSEPHGEQAKYKPKGKKANKDEVVLNKYEKAKEKLIFPMYQYDNGKLVEVGKISGMSKEDEAKIKKDIDSGKSVVIEVSFQERMESGKFRHPGYSRLRPDKPVKEVKMSSRDIPLSKRAARPPGVPFANYFLRDSDIKKIYELEYKLFELSKRPYLEDMANTQKLQYEEQLKRLLDKAIRQLNIIIRNTIVEWMGDAGGIDDPRALEYIYGADAKTLLNIQKKMSEYLTNSDNYSWRDAIVLFHEGLQAAHSSGIVSVDYLRVERKEDKENAPYDLTRDEKKQLFDELSEGKDIEKWQEQIGRISSRQHALSKRAFKKLAIGFGYLIDNNGTVYEVNFQHHDSFVRENFGEELNKLNYDDPNVRKGKSTSAFMVDHGFIRISGWGRVVTIDASKLDNNDLHLLQDLLLHHPRITQVSMNINNSFSDYSYDDFMNAKSIYQLQRMSKLGARSDPEPFKQGDIVATDLRPDKKYIVLSMHWNDQAERWDARLLQVEPPRHPNAIPTALPADYLELAERDPKMQALEELALLRHNKQHGREEWEDSVEWAKHNLSKQAGDTLIMEQNQSVEPIRDDLGIADKLPKKPTYENLETEHDYSAQPIDIGFDETFNPDDPSSRDIMRYFLFKHYKRDKYKQHNSDMIIKLLDVEPSKFFDLELFNDPEFKKYIRRAALNVAGREPKYFLEFVLPNFPELAEGYESLARKTLSKKISNRNINISKRAYTLADERLNPQIYSELYGQGDDIAPFAADDTNIVDLDFIRWKREQKVKKLQMDLNIAENKIIEVAQQFKDGLVSSQELKRYIIDSLNEYDDMIVQIRKLRGKDAFNSNSILKKVANIIGYDIFLADDEGSKYEKEKSDPKWKQVLIDTDGKKWTRKEIRDHYIKNADKIIKEIKGKRVMLYVNTGKVNQNVLKRHHDDKDIVLNDKKDIEYWADRRLLSIHRVFGPKTKLGFVDLDVHGDFSKPETLKYAREIASKIKSKYGSTSTIYESGGSGYHVEFHLKEEKPTDTLRGELRELCEDLNEKYDGFTTGIVKGSGVRTDVTTLKNNGNIRVPYALHESKGGVKKPVGGKTAGPKDGLSKRSNFNWEISQNDLEKIYELEYKLFRLGERKDLSDNAYIMKHKYASDLEALIDKSLPKMQSAFDWWLNEHADYELPGYEDDLSKAQHRVEETYKRLMYPPKELGEKVALFNHALNTLHVNGPMASRVIKNLTIWDAPTLLRELSSGEGFTDKWDNEVKRIAQRLSKRASMEDKFGIPKDAVYILQNYVVEDPIRGTEINVGGKPKIVSDDIISTMKDGISKYMWGGIVLPFKEPDHPLKLTIHWQLANMTRRFVEPSQMNNIFYMNKVKPVYAATVFMDVYSASRGVRDMTEIVNNIVLLDVDNNNAVELANLIDDILSNPKRMWDVAMPYISKWLESGEKKPTYYDELYDLNEEMHDNLPENETEAEIIPFPKKSSLSKRANKILFVYGTLKKGEENHNLLSDANFIGEASTAPEYVFGEIDESPALLEGGSTKVEGKLYEVSSDILKEIDEFEKPYVRQKIKLDDGQTVEAYFLPTNKLEALIEDLEKHAATLDYPRKMFREILSWIESNKDRLKNKLLGLKKGEDAVRKNFDINITDTEQYKKHSWFPRAFNLEWANGFHRNLLVVFHKGHGDGQRANYNYNRDTGEHFINIYDTVAQIKKGEISESIKHELTHMVQHILSTLIWAKNVFEDKDIGHYSGQAGIPEAYRKNRYQMYGHENAHTDPQVGHRLSDVEFFPLLADNIGAMRSYVSIYELRESDAINVPEIRQFKAKNIKQLPQELQDKLATKRFKVFLENNKFIKTLKQQPNKYQKALREMTRAFLTFKSIFVEANKLSSRVLKLAKDPLSTYKKKRDFGETPEPEGKAEGKNKHRFVIQRHKAKKSGEHFDLRLENDNGTMSSWAIPKHKLPTESEKLLATKTEDHPISYNKFKGEIPEGEYGAGHVDIHDSGTYEEIEWSGSTIKFKLKGKKEKGLYTLHKTDGNKWLLMKGKEE